MGKKNVFEELTKATKITPKDGEDYQKFAFRLAEGIAGLTDAQYDALSKDAQKWFVDSTAVLNANTEKKEKDKDAELEEIEMMSGYPEDEEEEETEEEEEETEEEEEETEETTETEEAPTPKKEASKKAAKPKAKPKEAEKPSKQELKVSTKKKAAKPASKPKVKAKVAPKVKTKTAKPKKEAGDAREINKDGLAYKVRVIAIKKPDTEWAEVVKQLGLKGAAAKENTYAYFRFAEAKRIMRIHAEVVK